MKSPRLRSLRVVTFKRSGAFKPGPSELKDHALSMWLIEVPAQAPGTRATKGKKGLYVALLGISYQIPQTGWLII